MRAFTRLPAPAVLSAPRSVRDPTPRWIHYGKVYQNNRQKKKGFEFQWPTVNGQKLNQHLLPDLQTQTALHCSYCDSYPLKPGDKSIDHFLPKTSPEYYQLVCQWENLYLACSHCQASKKTGFDPLVLRPDEEGYSFSRYFVYDYIKHKIEIKPNLEPTDYRRAKATREFFDFNNPALLICRERAFDWYQSKQDEKELDDFDFRFMFDF